MNDNGLRSPRVILQLLIFIVGVPLLPILISGRRKWREGWAYALVHIVGFVASRALAARRHPDLLGERARMLQHEDAEPWDRVLAPLVALGGGALPLVAGLDARARRSRTFSLPAKAAALAAIVAGFALGSYALIANRYFSGVVRIQHEREHHVVSGGPYRRLRHPGYAGAIVTYIATPVFLDAPGAFIPAGLLSALLVLRTYLEDRTLQAELPGYRTYTRRVRYRLLPGLW